MVKKIKTAVSAVSENIFIKYYTACEKIKNFSSFILNPDTKDKGAGTLATIAIVGLILAIGGVWASSKFDQTKLDFWSSLICGLGYFIVCLGQGFFNLCALFLTYVLSPDFFGHKITTDATFSLAWKSVRDIANMIIVLGFVIVGIATALRIQEYAAKKILWRLILIAIIINFSGLFCGVIIDSSNIIMTGLLGNESVECTINTKITKTSASACNINAISVAVNKYMDDQISGQIADDSANVAFDVRPFLSHCATLFIVLMFAGYSFIVMAILLAARYAVLAVLYIISPIAFAFWMFPAGRVKKYQTEWWDSFLRWSFMGVFAAFFIFLATKILEAGSNSGKIDIWVILISLVFLIVGHKMMRRNGGDIAGIAGGAVKGLASAGAGFAIGAVAMGAGGGAKILDKLSGGRGAAASQWASNVSGRALERIGLRQTETTAAVNSDRVDKKASSLSKEYTAAKAAAASGDKAGEMRMEAIRQQARTGRGADQAAAMKVIAENKDLGDTFKDKATGEADLKTMSAKMSYAKAAGATGVREKAEKADPRLRAYNQHLIKQHGSAEAAVADGFSRASIADIREFSNDTLKSREFIDNTPANKISRASIEMSASKVNAMKTHIPALEKEHIEAFDKATNPKTSLAETERLTEIINNLEKKLTELRTI